MDKEVVGSIKDVVDVFEDKGGDWGPDEYN